MEDVFGMEPKKAKVGSVFQTNCGSPLVVLEYTSAKKILVVFQDGLSSAFYAHIGNLRKGKYTNPYAKTMAGHGFHGEGLYSSKTHKAFYKTWVYMLIRCYSEVEKADRPHTAEHSCCEEWLNFQNFARWCEGQPGSSLTGWELDKDVLRKGNVVYSEDACCFIPRRINTIFPKRYAQGDRAYLTSDGEWQCQVRLEGKRKTFKSKDREKVVTFKVKATKEILTSLANTYKDSLAPHVYEALLSWEGY